MSLTSIPRRASAAFTTSGSVRMRRMSSMGSDGTRRPRARTTAIPRAATSVRSMPALEVRDLTITYGDTRAVTGLTFAAEPGEVLAVLGPNGAGKTSTIECLEGYR
ncbi:MAG: ATP-binding cassette domain-containing protein, partial [Acidimicrobiales bacterium]|nr:ATP-binding cassette domain-containing protein [Acidimicrobiales bacterium]